jgi:long-chain acyl-CoA synthetase
MTERGTVTTGQVLGNGVSDNARRMPDKPALIFKDEVRTFGELDARTNRLANVFAQLGIVKGDWIAVMLPNGFEWFEVSTAADKARVAVVPINWHLKRDEIAYILNDSGARLIVADAAFEDQVRAALEQTEGCQLLLVGDGGADDYEGAIGDADDEPHTTTGHPHVVYYTSGTSGRPKGVLHGSIDFDQPTSAGVGQVQLWWWSEDDIHICNGPAYHAGPLSYTSVALLVGASTVILERFNAREWLTSVERYKVTRGQMVPGHFVRILELLREEGGAYDLSSLKLIVHASAPCPINVKREMMELIPGCEIWELYGASEGGATRIGPEEWKRKPGSVGTPWPGVTITIRDAEGNELPAGEAGIIYITPPGATRFTYHNDADKTDQAWIGNSFTVGDMGYVDEDGYLFLTDRVSDMIIRGGVNIYPREIEEVISQHPAVVDCAVFGIPDPRFNELIKAVVEVRTSTTPDEIAAWCRERIADFKVPHVVEIVAELPRTPTGKVLKRYLREQHWSGQPSAVNTE